MTRKEITERSRKRKEEAKVLFESGMGYREVAKKIGLSEKTVQNWKNEMAIKTDPYDGKQKGFDDEFIANVRILWPVCVNRILGYAGKPLQEVPEGSRR